MKGASSMHELQILMTGLAFGESPRWRQDRLWISDWSAREIIAVNLEGKSEMIARAPSFPDNAEQVVSAYPIGSTLDVWYEPQRPQEAALDIDLSKQLRRLLLGSAISLSIALCSLLIRSE